MMILPFLLSPDLFFANAFLGNLLGGVEIRFGLLLRARRKIRDHLLQITGIASRTGRLFCRRGQDEGFEDLPATATLVVVDWHPYEF